MTLKEFEELQKQVLDFGAMRLPGQPPMVHMGTVNMVSDLWKTVKEYKDRLVELGEIVE